MISKAKGVRALIVDDHPIIRKGLAQLIEMQRDMVAPFEADNGAQALEILKLQDCNFVILDISLGTQNGIEVLRQIKAKFPRIPVLMVSMHDESIYAHRALRAGAAGYLTKSDSPERIVPAIRKIMGGELFLPPRLEAILLNRLTGKSGRTKRTGCIEDLSDRELEVFTLLGQGIGTRAIAERLTLGIKTVETHRANIKDKLGLHTAMELVHHAIQWAGSGELPGAPL
jgi:DNA-binding NarL/FixJ family response regulator